MILTLSLLFLFFSVTSEGEPINPSVAEQKKIQSRKTHQGFKKPTQINKQNTGIQKSTSPMGRKSKIPFSRSLPEDISNENFPDTIESFDYPNVPLMDLIQAMGKLTGLNFIIDPGVANKKITILAPSKITVAEAYKAFLSALAANGYTVVKSGAFWKIRETKSALKDNTEIYSGGYFPNTDQLITRIVKLKHISAKEFSQSIKPLTTDGRQVSSHEASNTIIISDYGAVIERIMKLARVMDVPGSEESVKVISIVHAAATDLAQILNELLSLSGSRISTFRSRRRTTPRVSSGSLKKGQNSGNIKVSHIIPDERTNSLIVSANKNGLKRVRDLVNKLDTYVDPSRTGGIYVYNVLYGTAEQVYNTLMGITPSQQKTALSKSRSFPRSPHSSAGGRARSAKSFSSSSSALFPNVTIMADPNTNSLIISARNKYDFERVKAVLKKIDVPKDQVFVQAVIVEMYVGQGDSWETNLIKILDEKLSGKIASALGFSSETGASIAKFITGGGAGFLNKRFSPNLDSLQKLSFGPGFVFGLPPSKFLGDAIGSGNLSFEEYSRQIHPDEDLSDLTESERKEVIRGFNQYQRGQGNQVFNRALGFPMNVLQILKEVGDINVLSTPQITAMDNIPAIIEVGENAPIGLTTTSSGLGSSNAVERADIVLRLELTPRINPDSGIIQMDISQKFDDLSSTESPASELRSRAVHTVKRLIETKLVLHDGETAVLGGLMTDKEIRTENKVPVLGDIPVLGWLFKGSTVKKQKRNLIVFLTPTIIRGKDQKDQNRRLLGKKLEERIEFIKRNMKGADPHGEFLKKLTAKTMDTPVELSEEATVPDAQEVEWVDEPAPSDFPNEPQGMEIIEDPASLPETSPSIRPFQADPLLPAPTEESQDTELIEEEPVSLPETSPPINVPQQMEEKLMVPTPTEESQDTELIEEESENKEQDFEKPSPLLEEPTSKPGSFWDKIWGKKSKDNQKRKVIEKPEETSPGLTGPFPQNQPSDENSEEEDPASEDNKKKEGFENSLPYSSDSTQEKPASDKNKEPVLIEHLELFPKE